MLSDVTKRGALQDLDDGLGINAKALAQTTKAKALRVKTPNLSHLIVSQFARVLAPLTRCVHEIVGLRADKQVMRITARAIVAPMADEQTVRNWTARQLIGYSVRGALFSSVLERTVSAVAVATQVRPATIRTCPINLSPEPISLCLYGQVLRSHIFNFTPETA